MYGILSGNPGSPADQLATPLGYHHHPCLPRMAVVSILEMYDPWESIVP